jgi:hypothetical protein
MGTSNDGRQRANEVTLIDGSPISPQATQMMMGGGYGAPPPAYGGYGNPYGGYGAPPAGYGAPPPYGGYGAPGGPGGYGAMPSGGGGGNRYAPY